MRKILFILTALLLTLQAGAEKYTLKMDVTVNENPYKVDARWDSETDYHTIGFGYNACIPHQLEGELVIKNYKNKNNLISVGQFAFRFCTGITRIVIEEGIDRIEDYAFVGCSGVTSIELPSTLTEVGRGAFAGMPRLGTVIVHGATPPEWLCADVFSYEGTAASMTGDAQKRILYVPEGSIEAFKSYQYNGSVGWKDAFARIYEYSEEPQTIGSLAELEEFRDAVNNGLQYKNSTNKSVRLTADIEMPASGYAWTPIGDENHPYDGIFDGGGHVIKNLTIDNAAASCQGLFGKADKAIIYNMHLLNPQVCGHDYVGSVLGYAANDTHVTDILVTSDASRGDDYTVRATAGSGGGIVGWARNATIERCLFRGQVKCYGWAGGIVGNVYSDVTVTDCSASNFIQNVYGTNSWVGGIVGGAGKVSVNRCFARNVLADIDASGTTFGLIVGGTNRSDASTIENCVYWTRGSSYQYYGLIGTHNVAPSLTGNVAYSSDTDMNQDKTKATLGEECWYYFTDSYLDFPVPLTLKDMYLRDFVLGTDDSGLVYQPVGGDITHPTAYEVTAYTGSATALVIPATYKDKPVTAIQAEVFKDNQTLTAIALGTNLQTIGASAFENCDQLRAVVLPDAVTTVGARAFRDCDNLESFNIGKGFKEHSDNFIADCPKLTTLTASHGNDNGYACVDDVLIHNAGTYRSYVIVCAPGKQGDYVIPVGSLTNATVNVFGSCFAGCSNLTSVTFPEGKRYSLGKAVFDGASNLSFVDMSRMTGTIDNQQLYVDRFDENNPFYGLDYHTFLYLPEGQGHKVSSIDANTVFANDSRTAGTAGDVELDDAHGYRPLMAVTATEGVWYDRYVNYFDQEEDNKQGLTLYLPYDVAIDNEQARIYEFADVQDIDGVPTVTFRRLSDEDGSYHLQAYKPYYAVAVGTDIIDLSNYDTDVLLPLPPTEEPAAIGDLCFKGTTTGVSVDDLIISPTPVYQLQMNGVWTKVTEDSYNGVNPFCAYFQATSMVTADTLAIVLDEHYPEVTLQDQVVNPELLEMYNGQVVNVTYDRVFAAKDNGDGTWTSRAYTVCLPYNYTFPVNMIEAGDVKVYYLMEVDTEKREFIFTNEFASLEAGMPYVVVINKGSVNLNANGVRLTKQPYEGMKVFKKGAEDEQIGWWRGTLSFISNDECTERNIYMQQSTGKFRLAHNQPEKFKVMYLNPFRCYFEPLEPLNEEFFSQKFSFTENGLDFGEVTDFPADGFEGDNPDIDETTGISPVIRTIDADGISRYYDMQGRPLQNKPNEKGVYIENHRKVVNK
jgi:hypothetical protein